MRVSFATEPGQEGRENEDFIAATANVAVLLDGAGNPAGAESGCSHGVAWFVRQLGTRILDAATNESTDLTNTLRTAIKQVAALHESSCDLTHPGSPSTTVIILRERRYGLEYLVLADSVLLIRGHESTAAITDDREAVFAEQLRPPQDVLGQVGDAHDQAIRAYVEKLRQHRNREGGYWLASADPEAAGESLSGVIPAHDAQTVALLSDGASRPVDRFDLMTWDQAVNELTTDGPSEWLRTVRRAEDSDPDASRWPRTKIHDDATAAIAIPSWA